MAAKFHCGFAKHIILAIFASQYCSFENMRAMEWYKIDRIRAKTFAGRSRIDLVGRS